MQPLRTNDPSSIGPYRLLGRLGAGGMGQVYLGVDAAGIPVAVKVVHPGFAHDEQFRRRFRREVDAGRCIRAGGIAVVLAADPDAAAPWLATEYVPGPSLDAAVRATGPLPAETVHRLAAGLAGALADIHAAGLVHRDVKPSNVLLAVDRPRLIDFGIARAADATHLTSTGVVFGTPAFMSPEQAAGEEAEAASDVFSLAGVVVHALAGRPPFGEGTPVVLLRRICDDEPDLDAVPAPLREPIAACFAKRPADRPTAAELVGLLAPVPDAPPSSWLPAALAAPVPTMPDPGDPTLAGANTRVSTTEPYTSLVTEAPAARRISRRAVLVGLGTAAVGVAGAGAYAVTVNRLPWPVSASAEGPAPVADGSRTRWSITLDGGIEALTVRDGTLYAVAGTTLHALHATTGVARWSVRGSDGYVDPVGFIISRGVALWDELALLQTNGAVLAVDAASGARRWGVVPEPGNLHPELPLADMTAAGGAVFVTLGGSLHALDAATGEQRWRYDFPGVRTVASEPTVDGAQVLVVWGANVSALDTRSGRERWRYDSGEDVRVHIAVAAGTVFMTSSEDRLVALDAANGAPRWEATVGSGGPGLRSPALGVAGELVLVRGKDQQVHAFEVATGAQRWVQPDTVATGAVVDVGPVAVAGTVYCASDNGRVYALDAASGGRRWEHVGESGYTAVLAADGDTVYVGRGQGIEALASESA